MLLKMLATVHIANAGHLPDLSREHNESFEITIVLSHDSPVFSAQV